MLVAPEGTAFAVRTTNGRLAMLKSGSDTFAFRDWLTADADGRDPKDKTLGDGIRCDAAGCIARLADNSIIAIVNSVEAFAEDCRRAAVVLSAREAPLDCGALLIDRKVWKRTGAVALRRTGEGFEIAVARPPGYDRPWARAPEARTKRQQSPAPASSRRNRATPRQTSMTWSPETERPAADRTGQEDQYRRNSPTSLPWIRTRLGGRIRTS